MRAKTGQPRPRSWGWSVSLLLVLFLVPGCGVFRPSLPPVIKQAPGYSVTQFNAAETAYNSAVLAKDIDTATFYRDQMQWSIISDIDRGYFSFRDNFTLTRSAAKTGADVAKLALSATATLIGGSAVISAAVTALQGAQLAVDQNLFEQQLNDTLLTTLDALRDEQLAVINTKMRLPPPEYSFREAFDDTCRLFNAGTIASGLQRIASTAAQQKAAAQTSTTTAIHARMVAPPL